MSTQAANVAFRALVVGWYGAPNVGDEVLLAIIKHRVEEMNGELVATSVDPAYTRRAHGIHAVDYNNLGEIAAALMAVDVVILGGGGIFEDVYPFVFALHTVYDPALNDVAAYARPVLMARQFGIPVVIWAHGVGPLQKLESRDLVCDVFNNATAVSVRDEASARLLREVGVQRDIVVGPDPAWLYADYCLGIKPDATARPATNVHRLAVVVREWDDDSDWEAKLVAAFKAVTPADWSVVWVAFQADVARSGAISDVPTVERLRALVPDWAKGTVETATFPRQAWDLLASADAIVSMRLHASILGLSAGKPLVGLEYDAKLAHAHEMAGMPRMQRIALNDSAEHYAAALRALLSGAGGWAPSSKVIESLGRQAQVHLKLLDTCCAGLGEPRRWVGGHYDWVAGWMQQLLGDLRSTRATSQHAHELLQYRDFVLSQKDGEISKLAQDLHAAHIELDASRAERSERVAYIAEKEAYVAALQAEVGQLKRELDKSQFALRQSQTARAQLAGLAASARRTMYRMVVAPGRFIAVCRRQGVRAAISIFRDRLNALGRAPVVAVQGLPRATAIAAPARTERALVVAGQAQDGVWPSRALSLAAALYRTGFAVRLYLTEPTNGAHGLSPELARLICTEAELRQQFLREGTRVFLASAAPRACELAGAALKAGAEVILDLDSVEGAAFDTSQRQALLAVVSRAVSHTGDAVSWLPGVEVDRIPDGGDGETFDAYKDHARPAVCQEKGRTIVVMADRVDTAPIISDFDTVFPGDLFLVAGTDITETSHVLRLPLQPQLDLVNYLAAASAVLVVNGGGALSHDARALMTAALLIGRPVVTDADVDAGMSINLHRLGQAKWSDAVQSIVPVDDYAFVTRSCWISRAERLMRGRFPDSVSAIVLIHNNRNIIERCVSTLLLHCSAWLHEIVVVDNNSTDGGAELVEQLFGDNPQVKLVRNPENGCSSGRNLGVSHSSGEYLAFFDSDQWLTSPTCFAEAVFILQAHPDIGAIGWNAGWFDPMRGDFGGPISDGVPARGMNQAALEKGYRDDIGFLGTSGMFMRRDLFDRLDGFDTYYDPTCFEDTDLCFQIKQAGYAVALRDFAGIRHQPHQTTGASAGSVRYQKLFARNAEYFGRKWKSYPEFFSSYTP